MPKFISYTNENYDTLALSNADFKSQGGYDGLGDWQDYVWQDVSNSQDAIDGHEVALDTYMAQQNGQTLEEYLDS